MGNFERIQIINDEKHFADDLSTQVERWGLSDVGLSYNVVAVFGSQSTGKSTLLNLLFGTAFDVMDETKRQRTTKGIWICRGHAMNVMVMDVEGTDSRERGEDQDFERKSALFSLVSSEVLLINLWEQQVGLYQGANMGLLKTVLEVNLGLFGKLAHDGTRRRTLLLFVVRDHTGVTPLENLSQTLTSDLIKLWDSLSKPSGLGECELKDYFDLSFTALPHKILAPQKFEQEVARLRERFTNRRRDDFVFKPAYHKNIPADGLAVFMENIWQQVQSNKDLDLPTQQELLAQFRCDEIAHVTLVRFSAQAHGQKPPVEAGKVVEGLGWMMRTWKGDALTQFDATASRYHLGIYRQKRQDLLAQMNTVLSPLFIGQLKNLHKAVLTTFQLELQDKLRGVGYHFGEVVAHARDRLETQFRQGAEEAGRVIEDGESGVQWSWREEEELLRQDIIALVSKVSADEAKKMVNQIEQNFKRQISEPVELHLNQANSDMWDQVLIAFRVTLENAERVYLLGAKSLNCSEDEIMCALAVLQQRTWLVFRSEVDKHLGDAALLGKLHTRFEEKFLHHNTGIPRVWKLGDDIVGIFREAMDETIELLNLFAEIVPKDPALIYQPPSCSMPLVPGEADFDFSSTLRILAPTKTADLTTQFKRSANAYYVEAERSMISSVSQVPLWMYWMLVVLGWNEAMAVLFNPLYLVVLICAMGTMWFIMQLDLAGPLYHAVQLLTNEIQGQVSNYLRARFLALFTMTAHWKETPGEGRRKGFVE